MQKNILTSVVNITGQKDIESLEYSLLATIAELIPARSISLYKPVIDKNYGEVEEVLQLWVQTNPLAYHWSEEPVVLEASHSIKECFHQGQMQELPGDDGKGEVYFPICGPKNTLAVLRLDGVAIDESRHQLLDGFTKVYRNYLLILNESERDKLTGLLNRRTFEQRLDRLLAAQKKRQIRALRDYENKERRHHSDDKVILAILDIDFFKRINDEYGHIYGDEILLLMAKLMRESFRKSDLLFRFGGEEFIILLEPTSSAQAFKTLERFRDKVATYKFSQAGKITVSIGYTAMTEDSFITNAIGRADQALYYSKNHGRNCTYCYEELVSHGQITNPTKTGSVELF